jgi:hypothetical protein
MKRTKKPPQPFCLECTDTGYLPNEFGQDAEPCPHCDTGAAIAEAKEKP